MLSKKEKHVDRIQRILERLKADSLKGIPIVVEGKKDVQALNFLGIIGNIVKGKTSGKTLLDVLDEIENTRSPEIILLFDFDRRGKELTKLIASRLEAKKIIPNLNYWKMLLGLVGRELKDIEGLATYLENLKNKHFMS